MKRKSHCHGLAKDVQLPIKNYKCYPLRRWGQGEDLDVIGGLAARLGV